MQEPLYGSFLLAGIAYNNEGTISNGYCYGENIQAIYTNIQGSNRYVAPIVLYNQEQVKYIIYLV